MPFITHKKSPHFRIVFATVKGASKVSLKRSVPVEDLENSCQLFFLLRALSWHSIWKSRNCSGIGCLHFIPEELFWKNLNFPWQSCAGKHWVKSSRIAESSPLKDYRSKFVSRLPPIYILLSNGNQISFQGPCSINTYSASGKHMQLNFHHKIDKKKKNRSSLPKITFQWETQDSSSLLLSLFGVRKRAPVPHHSTLSFGSCTSL